MLRGRLVLPEIGQLVRHLGDEIAYFIDLLKLDLLLSDRVSDHDSDHLRRLLLDILS